MAYMAQTTDLDATIRPVAHGLNETFQFCMVKREIIPCYKLFEQIKSVDAGMYTYFLNKVRLVVYMLVS